MPTFAEVAEDWFRSKTDQRPSHVSDLRTRLDKHLLPRFGARRLDTIRAAELSRRYAPITINQILRIAGAVFRLAIKHGRCATNPVERVDRARRPAREIKPDDEGGEDGLSPDSILDPDDVRRLLEAARPGLERTLFLAAFVTGARLTSPSPQAFSLRRSSTEVSGRKCKLASSRRFPCN